MRVSAKRPRHERTSKRPRPAREPRQLRRLARGVLFFCVAVAFAVTLLTFVSLVLPPRALPTVELRGAEIPVAAIQLSPDRKGLCRHLLFHNDTGRFEDRRNGEMPGPDSGAFAHRDGARSARRRAGEGVQASVAERFSQSKRRKLSSHLDLRMLTAYPSGVSRRRQPFASCCPGRMTSCRRRCGRCWAEVLLENRPLVIDQKRHHPRAPVLGRIEWTIAFGELLAILWCPDKAARLATLSASASSSPSLGSRADRLYPFDNVKRGEEMLRAGVGPRAGLVDVSAGLRRRDEIFRLATHVALPSARAARDRGRAAAL